MVHGPFGTGKSTLLVALLEFFVAAGAKRCLVAANTNVAVDRILVGLLERGFTGVLPPCLQQTCLARTDALQVCQQHLATSAALHETMQHVSIYSTCVMLLALIVHASSGRNLHARFSFLHTGSSVPQNARQLLQHSLPGLRRHTKKASTMGSNESMHRIKSRFLVRCRLPAPGRAAAHRPPAAAPLAALRRGRILMKRSSHGSWCAADFLRVGALRRIDRRLLRHSLHCGAGGRERGDGAAELADMLKAATSPAEAAVLRAELAEARCLCLLARQCLVPCQHRALKGIA